MGFFFKRKRFQLTKLRYKKQETPLYSPLPSQQESTAAARCLSRCNTTDTAGLVPLLPTRPSLQERQPVRCGTCRHGFTWKLCWKFTRVVLFQLMPPHSCMWTWSLHVFKQENTPSAGARSDDTVISHQSLSFPSNVLDLQGRAQMTRLLASGTGAARERREAIPNSLCYTAAAHSRALRPPRWPGLETNFQALSLWNHPSCFAAVAEAAVSQFAKSRLRPRRIKAAFLAPALLPGAPHWGLWIHTLLRADRHSELLFSSFPLAGLSIFWSPQQGSLTHLNGKELSQFLKIIVFCPFIELQVSWESPMKTKAGQKGTAHEGSSWQHCRAFQADERSGLFPARPCGHRHPQASAGGRLSLHKARERSTLQAAGGME